MMILNWCRSLKNNQTKNAEEEEEEEEEEEIGNIETMKQFDFLFYLPLRRLQKGGKIREMILWYYKDEIPEEILDDILLNIPEKCFILADGLDEWTPNYDEQRPLHVTVSLPYSEDIKDVTLLMTSRPSAPGVLNMTFTEIDLKITMCGIPAKSIDSMTEKYLLSLSKESNKDMVLKKLKARKIDHIEKTPLLLQQLIWMIAHDIDVGECLSDYYSSLVNIALKWTEEKVGQKKLKTVSSSHIPAELCLPSKLMEYDAYWSNRNLLFILGKIAFDLLINEKSQMSFGRAKLNRDGLDDDVIDMILTTGLLTEDNCRDNTKQQTQLAFTHASFQEYFAALYIASHDRIKQNQIPDDMKQMPSPAARSQPQNEDILELFFRRCSSVQGILQFGVVLRFLCGLDSKNLSNVCEHIYQTAQRDEEYSMLRDQHLTSTISGYDEYVRTTLNLQKLIKSCICECTVKYETSFYKIPVLDLIISDYDSNDYKALLQCAIPQKVLNLSIIGHFGLIRPDLYENYVVEFHNLQTIAIELNRRDLPITALSQHISKTNSIRKIKLITMMDIDGLPVVTVNLRGHHQLQLINVRGDIKVINFDTSGLEIIKQTGSPMQHSYVFFNELSKGGVVIPKLRHLELSSILLTPELAKFISHNVTLNVLRLCNCFGSFIRGDLRCIIDLSAYNNLQVLEIIGSFNVDIKSVNTTNLNTVITDRHDVHHGVRNAPRLTSLTFGKKPKYFTFDSVQFTELINEDVCSCSQLQKIDLKCVTIQDEALVLSSGMKNLKRITLDNVGMSLTTWIRFVNSLLTLKQSVTVKVTLTWLIFKSLSDNEKFKSQSQYVRDNENKFKLIESDARNYFVSMTFETVPK